MIAAFLGSIIGIKVFYAYFKKTNKLSYIIFFLVFALISAAILSLYIGIKGIVIDSKTGDVFKFQDICSNSIWVN